jgi:hypothetical protein
MRCLRRYIRAAMRGAARQLRDAARGRSPRHAPLPVPCSFGWTRRVCCAFSSSGLPLHQTGPPSRAGVIWPAPQRVVPADPSSVRTWLDKGGRSNSVHTSVQPPRTPRNCENPLRKLLVSEPEATSPARLLGSSSQMIPFRLGRAGLAGPVLQECQDARSELTLRGIRVGTPPRPGSSESHQLTLQLQVELDSGSTAPPARLLRGAPASASESSWWKSSGLDSGQSHWQLPVSAGGC